MQADGIIEIVPMSEKPDLKNFNHSPKDLSYEWDIECERIEELVRNNRQLYFGETYDVVSVGQPCQRDSIIVGRVLNDDPSQKLTPHSLLIEGNRRFSHGGMATLRIDKLNEKTNFYLYLGKIVVCLGVCSSLEDPSHNVFHVYDMISGLAPLAAPPKNILPKCLSKSGSLCVLGGPFFASTASDKSTVTNFDFNRLRKACHQIRMLSPGMAVVLGPFLHSDHQICKSGKILRGHGRGYTNVPLTYQAIYLRMFHILDSELVQKGIRTLIVPHSNDVISCGHMPQRPLDVETDYKTTGLLFAENPCLVNLNGMGVLIVGQDMNADLAPENVRGQAITNVKKKITHLNNEMIHQGSIMSGVIQSSVKLQRSSKAVRCFRIASGIDDEKFSSNRIDPNLIIHTVTTKFLPKKFFPMCHDRAIGSVHQSLVHVKVSAIDPNNPIGHFFNAGGVNGRVSISSYIQGK
eukprot:GHVH01006676.1.p1 GENE.GHVH01006676.1~~GHVH01006676.1.p1  ORF type:complete len:463 (+),score=44.76 GHVH01006676.1:493-1881(+)